MSPDEEERFVQTVYDSLFGSITDTTPEGASQPSVQEAPDSLLVLCMPGQGVSGADFQNAWTPSNTSGSFDAALAMQDISDQLPAFNANFEASGLRLHELYGELINDVVVTPDPPDPTVQQERAQAWSVLYTQPPASSSPTDETQQYQTYNELAGAYRAAFIAYLVLESKYTKDPVLKDQWPELGPTFWQPVTEAWSAWRGAAPPIEEAQAILQATNGQNVAVAFQNAQSLYQTSGRATAGSNAADLWPISLHPGTWWDETQSSGWTTISWSGSDNQTSSNSDYTTFGGSGGLKLGLFSIGGGGSSSTQHQHLDTAADDFSAQYDFLAVDIDRPWFIPELFGLPSWGEGTAYPPGSLSTGDKSMADQQNAKFSLLPVRMVVIRNLSISVDTSSSEYDATQKALQANLSVGYGPFSISGNYAHGSKSQTYQAHEDNGTYTLNGMQILGYMCQIMPYSPPKAA